MVLLLVFSLNTVVSFACSLGGIFHTFHHHSATQKQPSHGQHQPQEGHHHDHGTPSHQHDNKGSEKPADDCCSKNVVVLEKMEKAVSRTVQAPDAVFLTLFLTSFSTLFSLFPSEEKTLYPDRARWRPPVTIQDLRIVIQSFQI